MQKFLLTLASLLLAAGPVGAEPVDHGTVELYQEEDPYDEGRVLRGWVVSAGRVDPTEDIGTGFFLDANVSSVAVNGGIATKRFGESPVRPSTDGDEHPADNEQVTNAYAGIGFSRILMLQWGYGTEGAVMRLRSDWNVRAIMDFFQGQPTPKRRLTIGDRLTFTLSIEDYRGSDKAMFDNATWGIGLLF